MSVFALVLARADGGLGPKLHPSTVDCRAEPVRCQGMETARFIRGGATTMARPGRVPADTGLMMRAVAIVMSGSGDRACRAAA